MNTDQSNTYTNNLIWLHLKNTSMPNPAEGLGHITCFSSSSPRSIKSPSNSIRSNCQKICSSSRRPNTILEIRKNTIFLWVINYPISYKFFNNFTNHGMRTNKPVVFRCIPFPNIPNIRIIEYSCLLWDGFNLPIKSTFKFLRILPSFWAVSKILH